MPSTDMGLQGIQEEPHCAGVPGPALGQETHQCPGSGPQAGSTASPPAAGALCIAAGGHGKPRG